MKVRIKDWAELEKEFGLDNQGDIDCYCVFTKGMREYCGKVIEVNRNNIGRTGMFKHDGWFFDNETYEIIEE